jgi:hypothetical protein
METKTEQRHQHLTEEEQKISAQIRSVAATLYERVDLNIPTVEFLREHFYKDPRLALAYFYCCSTDPCVAIFNDKLQPDVDGSVIWNRISNLIGSPIGQEEAMLCQEIFNNLDQSVGRDADIAQIVFIHLLVNTPSLRLTSTGIVIAIIARRRCRFHLSVGDYFKEVS